MKQVTVSMVEQAQRRLSGVIHETPLERSQTYSELTGGEIYLKYENQQKTGSFKLRGAYNCICELKENGEIPSILAASAGNHAQGVAYAAAQLGIPSTIVMPKSTPIAKVQATEGYGAQVMLHGDCYDSACGYALKLREETGGVFIHPFDDPAIIAGQGTIAPEILKVIPSVDVILLPAGGGGLLSGVALYIKAINPRVRIIGVQAEGAQAICRSFYEKREISLQNAATIADGIAVRTPGKLTMELISQHVDEMVTVSDSEISAAILLLLERGKQVVEPAGAASLAAVLSGKADVRGKRAVCVLSGGNVDVSFIHRIIEIGLVSRSRKLKFKTVMPDIPGTLEKFSGVMGDNFANIVHVHYDRMHADLDPNEVVLHIACEVGGKEHGEKVVKNLKKAGYQVIME